MGMVSPVENDVLNACGCYGSQPDEPGIKCLCNTDSDTDSDYFSDLFVNITLFKCVNSLDAFIILSPCSFILLIPCGFFLRQIIFSKVMNTFE